MDEIPAILEMKPLLAKRTWKRFCGDNNIVHGTMLFDAAENVRCSIESVIMNRGRPAELAAQRNLERNFGIFRGRWAVR